MDVQGQHGMEFQVGGRAFLPNKLVVKGHVVNLVPIAPFAESLTSCGLANGPRPKGGKTRVGPSYGVLPGHAFASAGANARANCSNSGRAPRRLANVRQVAPPRFSGNSGLPSTWPVTQLEEKQG